MQRRHYMFLLGFDVFTVILWGWTVLVFFSHGTVVVPGAMVDVYLLVLVYYAGDKEIRRWRRRYRSTARRGEWFVYGWVATTITMLCIEVAGGHAAGFRIPEPLPLITGSVATVYLITEYLKFEFRRR